uniref:Uncharacterized protein n=2 Tax=viral metagenome TaxID=1070528 RepID=A0A6M3L725_9ZZZZ
MITQEMQEKVARWCGFVHDKSVCQCEVCRDLDWIAPDAAKLSGVYYAPTKLPDFTSLDVLFKWCVPHIITQGWLPSLSRMELEPVWIAELFKEDKWYDCKHELPGLALFLAIYRLVEVEDEVAKAQDAKTSHLKDAEWEKKIAGWDKDDRCERCYADGYRDGVLREGNNAKAE